MVQSVTGYCSMYVVLDLDRVEACDEYTVPVMLLDMKFFSYDAIIIPTSLSLVVFLNSQENLVNLELPLHPSSCSCASLLTLSHIPVLGKQCWLARLELPRTAQHNG